MANHRIIVAGFGGQGVMLIGQILAYAGMVEGKHVTWMPSYGPEMRGGTANCTIIISDEPIASPIVSDATAVVAMNEPSLKKFESLLEEGGKLFVNTSLIGSKNTRDNVSSYGVDSNEIAMMLGNIKVSNIVMLGAIIQITGAVSEESIIKTMEKLFVGKKAAMIPDNIKALSAWTK